MGCLAISRCAGFELREDFLGTGDDITGEAGELGNVDAVGAVGAAGGDLSEKDHLALFFGDEDVEVECARESIAEFDKLMVVSGKSGAGAEAGVVVDVLDDGPRDGEAVIGAGSPARLVQDDEGAVGGLVEDGGGFDHLNHEC